MRFYIQIFFYTQNSKHNFANKLPPPNQKAHFQQSKLITVGEKHTSHCPREKHPKCCDPKNKHFSEAKKKKHIKTFKNKTTLFEQNFNSKHENNFLINTKFNTKFSLK